MRTRHARPLLAALAAASVFAHAPGEDDPYRRLGDAERRVALAEIETRPFPADRLAACSAWTGEPLTPGSIENKVVVLLAWDSEEARSVRLLPTLARLERSRGDDAVFVAVHAEDHWDSAQEKIDAGRVRCLSAHDADGSLFEALGADEHPNLYVVDRSGHTRAADLDPRDLPRVLAALVRETPEEARADLPRRVALLGELRDLTSDEPSPTAYPGAQTEPETRVTVPPTAYARAVWPPRNTQYVNATDLQGQRVEVPAGTETWLTEQPERPVGDHVLILDFWATWCGPCIAASPKLEAMQRAHEGELMVLALSGQAAGSKRPEDIPAIRRFIESHPVSYSHLHDARQTLYKRFSPAGIPHVAVLSTDGVVRWQGNPHDPRFDAAVRQVVGADPLLAARRAAAAGED